MRIVTAASLMMIATATGGSPAHAQGGEFMWCAAWTEDGSEKAYFYSAFFAAGGWEAERKAFAFKSRIEREEASGRTVKATCMAPADYDAAVATRNAAMKGAPGKVLGWAG